jgi:beta-xylosidase
VWEDFGGTAPELTTDGTYDLSLTVRNAGDLAGAEVVQLYLHDPVASVTRPDVRLVGYRRLELAPGESRRVTFRFHAELSAFTDRRGRRVVEAGDLELRLAASSADVRHTARLRVTGPVRELGPDRRLRCETAVS